MTEISWTLRRGPGEPPTVLAHRGGTGPWRENTLEAFSGALGAGADGVELDVRRCADGELVVIHDAEIPGVGFIHELRHKQLPSWVPTLEGALATCSGAIVNVEIKNVPTDSGYDPANLVSTDVASVLARGVGATGPWPAHVLVSSFWPDTLAAVGRADDGAPLGLLVHPSFDALSALDTAGDLGCVALNPHHSQASAELVGRAHSLDLAVVTWTVNNIDDLDALVEAGVDVVITDSVPDTLAHLRRL
jgi:glycerophosphoryl diester phosphodiesterase